MSVTVNGAVSAPKLYPLAALLDAWEQDAAAARTAYTTGTPRGPITGLGALDRELGGCLSAGVHVAHGSPGVGKTAFALQIAAACGCPALFLTTEMAPLELLRRITARLTSTYLGKLKTGELEPAASLALARRAVAAASLLHLADATRAYADPGWIHQAADGIRTHADAAHLLIVMDSVHSWAEQAAGGVPEYDRLNAALLTLGQLARSLGVSVLAIAERNRASMGTGGLSASAGTRRFEYTAESVLDLDRPKDTPPDAAGEVPITLTLAKNRHGAAGRALKLKFHGALQRYREDGPCC